MLPGCRINRNFRATAQIRGDKRRLLLKKEIVRNGRRLNFSEVVTIKFSKRFILLSGPTNVPPTQSKIQIKKGEFPDERLSVQS